MHYGETLAREIARRVYPYALADTAALTAIPAASRVDAMMALVSGDPLPWVFDSDSAASASADVKVPDAGSGRWLRSTAGTVSVQKRTVTVGHADLTNAVNGSSQAINIGAVLPANARIMGVDLRAYTPFTGGATVSVALDIGSSGDVDALVDGADVLAAAVDSGPSTRPAGIRPNKMFATAGAQLIATFIPDGAHALSVLDAGSIIIDVLFIELA